MVAIIHMDINRIGDLMKSSPALKWVVTQGNQILGQGNFVGANSGDTLDLVNNIEVTFLIVYFLLTSL